MTSIEYRVRSGDTLRAIARRHLVTEQVLAQLNGISDINHIRAGQVLRIPKRSTAVATATARQPKLHQVQAKDTLESIAQQYNVPPDALMEANGITDPLGVRIGQRLTIPPGEGNPAGNEKKFSNPSKPDVSRAALATLTVAGTSSKAGADEPKTPQELKARFPQQLGRRTEKELKEILEDLRTLRTGGLDARLLATVKLLRIVQKDLKAFLQQVGVKNETVLKIADTKDLTEALEKVLDSSKSVPDRIAAGMTVAKELFAFVPEKDVTAALQKVFKGLPAAAQLVAMVGTLWDPEAGGVEKLKATVEFGVAVSKAASDLLPELGTKLRSLDSSFAILLGVCTLLDEKASPKERLRAAARLIANATDVGRDFKKVRELLSGWLSKLGVRNAEGIVKKATPELAGNVAEAGARQFDNVSPQVSKSADEAIAGMEAGVALAVRAAVLDNGKPVPQALAELVARLPEDSHEAVARLVRDFDEQALKLFLESSEAVDGAKMGRLIKALTENVDSKSVGKLLTGLHKVVSKFGLKMGKELGKKILKGLAKLVPVAGAVPAFADAWTNAQLAQDTKLPPIVRCLASLNASLNAVDGALGIIEVLGVTNVDAVVQVPLGLFELSLELIITAQKEQFDKNPKGYKTPTWMEGLVVGLAVLMGTAGIAQLVGILGLAGCERLLIKYAAGSGKLALKAAEYLNEQAAAGAERQLKTTAGMINALADILRNPEKYWAKAEAQLRNVVEGVVKLWNRAGALAHQLWEDIKKLGKDLCELGAKGLVILQWIAQNPGKIAEMALEAITGLAQRAGEALARAALATLVKLQAFYRDLKGHIKKGFENAVTLAKQAFDKVVDGLLLVIDKGGELASKALSALREVLVDLRALGEAGLEKLQWIARHPSQAARLALNAIQEMMKTAGQVLLQAGLVALGKLRDFYLDAKNRLKKGFEDALAAVEKTVESVLKLGKKGVDALIWLVKNPDEALARATAWAKNKLVQLASAVTELSKQALDALVSAGERAAQYVNKAIDALKKACDAALEKGQKALELIIWVAQNPKTVVNAVVKGAVDAVKSVAEGVSKLAHKATDALLRFIDEQTQVYKEARAAVADLIARTTAAGERMLMEWRTRLTRGGEEVLASLKNLKDAGAQLFKRIVAKGGKLIQAGLAHLNSMMQSGMQSALEAMSSLARMGGEAAAHVLNLLKGSVPVKFVRAVINLFADLKDTVRMSAFIKMADQAFKAVSQTYAEGGLPAVVKLIARTGYSVGSELVSVLWHRVVKTSMDIVDFARAFIGHFNAAELEALLGIDIPLVGN